MVSYEAIIVKPGHELAPRFIGSIPEIKYAKKCYVICDELTNNRWGSKWDQLYYAVDKVTKSRKGKIINWRIHKNLDYVQLYWAPKGCPTKLENGKHIHIIRPKYHTLFKCIFRLACIARRAKIRVQTRKSLIVANIFARHGIGHTNLTRGILAFV